MKKFLAVLFFVLCGAFLLWETGRIIMSWLAPWMGADSMFFDGQDGKLFLFWAILFLALVSWFVWPSLWRTQPGRQLEIKWGQALSIGLTVSGLLALFKVLFSGGYLENARHYGEARGYVLCDATRYKYFGELRMVKNPDDCEKK